MFSITHTSILSLSFLSFSLRALTCPSTPPQKRFAITWGGILDDKVLAEAATHSETALGKNAEKHYWHVGPVLRNNKTSKETVVSDLATTDPHHNLVVRKATVADLEKSVAEISQQIQKSMQEDPHFHPSDVEVSLFVTNHGSESYKLAHSDLLPAWGLPTDPRYYDDPKSEPTLMDEKLAAILKTLPKGVRIKATFGECFGGNLQKTLTDELDSQACYCSTAASKKDRPSFFSTDQRSYESNLLTSSESTETPNSLLKSHWSSLNNSGQLTENIKVLDKNGKVLGENRTVLGENANLSSSEQLMMEYLSKIQVFQKYRRSSKEELGPEDLESSARQIEAQFSKQKLYVPEVDRKLLATSSEAREQSLRALLHLNPEQSLASSRAELDDAAPLIAKSETQRREAAQTANASYEIENSSTELESSGLKQEERLALTNANNAATDAKYDTKAMDEALENYNQKRKELHNIQINPASSGLVVSPVEQKHFAQQLASKEKLLDQLKLLQVKYQKQKQLHEKKVSDANALVEQLRKLGEGPSASKTKKMELATHLLDLKTQQERLVAAKLIAREKLETAFLKTAPLDLRRHFMELRACEMQPLIPTLTKRAPISAPSPPSAGVSAPAKQTPAKVEEAPHDVNADES